MKTPAFLSLAAVVTLAITQPLHASPSQGAEHFEWSTMSPEEPIVDYSDCTDEVVYWLVDVSEVFLDKDSPGGQGHFLDHWLFEGTVEGQTTGYVWSTKGIVDVSGTYSGNNLTGKYGQVENALLKPLTPGAPRVRLDVDIVTQYNAAGELVVDRLNYVYHCVGN